MNICKRVFILAVLVGILFYVKASITVRVFRSICVIHDPKTVEDLICTVKPINRSTTFVNINGNIIRNVTNLIIHAQLFKKSEITYRPFLVNVSENYCDYFAKNKGGTYLRLVAPIYLPYTNMNHTCPFYGQGILKDFPVDSAKLKLPKFWPSGVFRLDLHASELNYGRILTIQLFFEITENRLS